MKKKKEKSRRKREENNLEEDGGRRTNQIIFVIFREPFLLTKNAACLHLMLQDMTTACLTFANARRNKIFVLLLSKWHSVLFESFYKDICPRWYIPRITLRRGIDRQTLHMKGYSHRIKLNHTARKIGQTCSNSGQASFSQITLENVGIYIIPPIYRLKRLCRYIQFMDLK